ncbi:hypothetical protein SERLADRAFT_456449 [Serpula lacrymans var. lacrymans S7.9]|uniref:Uncharacterized protein n=1 Tax=Serpula lacrymans var. lacrymans (strain S7.9) TaxID=578457 RepID=F8NGM9_SERL9|nr:uncharacterized protein SERLADRAFT_456449 [Serpula lacrymans var. lacrymans S7.9]EGO29111.1 hypothetical protein SERLADRAFT_456449 [Serpula lacrymans var. lacrymans S7.9]
MATLMQSSSPVSNYPSTPSRSSYYSSLSYQPINSSPLASPSLKSSLVSAQARRRSQYKPTTPRFRNTSSNTSRGSNPLPPCELGQEDPQRSFLRERFKVRCFERAQRQRERVVQGKRRSSDASSDLLDEGGMDCEEEEEDDMVMQDELFRRIMSNANHKRRHSYRLSYSHDVGSSFDPDMEDVSHWEDELRECPPDIVDEVTPEDLESEELAVYAEEYAALADFADLDANVEDFFLSDVEDGSLEPPNLKGANGDVFDDQCMDMT